MNDDSQRRASAQAQRPVPTWFVDGCSQQEGIKLSHSQSNSCPVTPITAANSCSPERAACYASGSMNHLLPPLNSCRCSHLGVGVYRGLPGNLRIPIIPVAHPSWLSYRDPSDTQLNSPSASPSSECSSPLDLSYKSSSNDGFESDTDCESPGSILRSLLSPTQAAAPLPAAHGWPSALANTPSPAGPAPPFVDIQVQVEDCALPASSPLALSCLADTPVQLAKKNIYPATSRISHWLVQITRFALEIPSFNKLSLNEQKYILRNSWHRLLLICMAEDNFQFAVSPASSSSHVQSANCNAHASAKVSKDHNSILEASEMDYVNGNSAQCDAVPINHNELPTMRFVETLQALITKMQTFKLNHIQYSLLSTAILFYTGNIDNLGFLPDERIQEMKRIYENVLTLLRQHIVMSVAHGDADTTAPVSSSNRSLASNNGASPSSTNGTNTSTSLTKDHGRLVYSKLLRILPAIYSVQKNLVCCLFCSCVGIDADDVITSAILAARSEGVA